MKGKKTALIFCLILALNVPLVFGAWIAKDIQDPESDQFQFESGSVWDGIDTLVLKDPSSSVKIALRFRGLNIDRNTRINGANLSFRSITTAYPFQANSSITIYGFAVDDVRPFDIVEPWNLPITSAHTIWNTSLVIEAVYYNVSVGNIIQEIVSRYGYTSASKMGFMLYSATGEQRVVYASEFTPYRGPRLYIQHGEAPPAPPGLHPEATYNSTVDGYDIYRIPGYGQVTSVVSGMNWDSSQEVYPFQEKTAYSNVSDHFYIFGGNNDNVSYLSKPRRSDVWNNRVNLAVSIPGGNMYSDFHLWKDGKTLDVTWIDTYPVNNYVRYQRFEIQTDGSINNVSDAQIIYQNPIKARPPITIMLDSEGYPYIAFATLTGATHSGQVAWSNLNNGTFNHTATSPLSVESASGGNPPNVNGPYVCELYRGGNRRMFLIYLVPDSPGDTNEVRSARNINSGAWIGEGDPTPDASNNRLRRWSVSGASICDDADSFNISLITPDGGNHELYDRPINVLAVDTPNWDATDILVMGATTNGIYYSIGAENNTKESRYRIRSGTWTPITSLRNFTEAVDDIFMWKFCGQQYPTFDGNKTIVSYAWRDEGLIAFWHDWFFLEDGPDPNVTDPYYEAWINGTLAFDCETLDCLTDIIEDFDPDPDDPSPGTWTGIGGLDRFRTKMIMLVVGLIMLMGSLLFGLAMKPSASTWIGIFFSMLVGWALLIATQTM